MEYFVIYNIATGEELVRMSGPAGASQIQPLGQDKGVVVVPDSFAHDMTPLSEIPPSALAPSLWNYCKIIRSQMLINGAHTEWGVVDSRAEDRLNLMMKSSAARLAAEDDMLEFTMKDNTVVSLSPTDMIEMVRQAMAFLDGIHCHARDLKKQLDEASDATQLLTIDVFRGWPAIPSEGNTNG